MKSLQWFHLISKSWEHLSLGVWGRDHGDREARFPFIQSYGHPEKREHFPYILWMNLTHSKCLNVRAVLKFCPSPRHQAWIASFEKKSYGKFNHKFKSVKTFNNGLTSCPKRPLFKTPIRRPICSVHSPLLLCIHGCTHLQSWLYSHWDVPFALPHDKNVRIIFPGNNIINMVGLSNISSKMNPADVC